MAARGRCPECGSESLVEDAHYAQQQLVCAACGCVLSEGLLTTTYTDEEHLREVAYSQSTGQKEQLSRCLQRGKSSSPSSSLFHLLLMVRKCPKPLGWSWGRALGACRGTGRGLVCAGLGGCCLLLIQLILQRSFNHKRKALIYIKKRLPLTVALSFPRSFRLVQPSANLPAPFLEDKEQLVARTMALVELASDTWLVTGRHPVPVVTAAAFLAWQSLRPGPRLSCPLARFCRLAGVELPPPAQLRLKELLEILLAMASQLSWLRGFRLDKKTVVKHIGDLLQHRLFLLKRTFSQQDGLEQQDTGLGMGSDSPGQGPPSSPAVPQQQGCPSAGQQQQQRGALRPLLPPCLLQPRKRLRAAAPSAAGAALTGDEPILDSEIEQYLRSPEEIRAFRRAKAWS
ncbi:BRF2 factor, partial [Calcarius ornatus]|nr:BRF2 factor [Calcarius ornatus]